MLKENHKTRHLREFCIYVLERDVFSRLFFKTEQQRKIVYDSYIQNIDALIEYTLENNLDQEKYFKSIKSILLKSKNVRERTR